jgi:hypothetical protein
MKKKVRESATGEQLRRDAGVRHLIFGGFFLLVFHLPQAGWAEEFLNITKPAGIGREICGRVVCLGPRYACSPASHSAATMMLLIGLCFYAPGGVGCGQAAKAGWPAASLSLVV